MSKPENSSQHWRYWWTMPLLIFIGIVGPGLAAAHADPGAVEPQVIRYAINAAPAMCSTLDSYPTVPGVQGVLRGIEADSGFTPYQSGQALALGVQADCQRHIPLLQQFVSSVLGSSTQAATTV